MTNAPLHSQPSPRHLDVLWRDQSWTMTAASSPCGRTAWIWKGRAGSPLPAARRQSGVGSIANARRRAGDCPPYLSRST